MNQPATTPMTPAPPLPPQHAPAVADLIRVVHPDETELIAGLLAAAYGRVGLFQWAAPRLATRTRILTGYFRLHVGHTLRHGTVYSYGTGRLRAVAGWRRPDTPTLPENYTALLDQATEPWNDRFWHIDNAVGRQLTRGCHHLVFHAVHPRDQHSGLGGALLAHHHRTLDRLGRTAVLDTLDPAQTAYYQRHGYTPATKPRPIRDAPTDAQPMRRPPHRVPTTTSEPRSARWATEPPAPLP